MANPSTPPHSKKSPSSPLKLVDHSIEAVILNDGSVESPQGHNQTISSLHISITNDTKPVLPANTTSDSATHSKSADDGDSNHDEEDIKTNDPDKTPSADHSRDGYIGLSLAEQIANASNMDISDSEDLEPEPEPRYEPLALTPVKNTVVRPRRSAAVNLPDIDSNGDDADDEKKYEMQEIALNGALNLSPKRGVSISSNKSSQSGSRNTTPSFVPQPQIDHGQLLSTVYYSNSRSPSKYSQAEQRRASASAVDSVSHGENSEKPMCMDPVYHKWYDGLTMDGYVREEWHRLYLSEEFMMSIADILFKYYHEADSIVYINKATYVDIPPGPSGYYFVPPLRGTHYDIDQEEENKAVQYQERGRRASISISISQETGHDSNHDEPHSDTPFELEDTPSVTNEAADEEVKEESNDTTDEHDSDDEVISHMMTAGGDNQRNAQQLPSLAASGPILRQLSDVTETDQDQEHEQKDDDDETMADQAADNHDPEHSESDDVEDIE